LQNQQFVLHYQPLVSLKDGRLLAVEALVRWQHPVEGLLRPARFLEDVESQGLILQLGDSLLERVVAQLRCWLDRHGRAPVVHVNIHPLQLLREGFAEQLAQVLERHCCSPTQLCLEIVENAVLRDMPAALDVLTRLRDQGIRVYVDDFGMGYAALSYLHQLPLTGIKIDGSLVQHLHDSQQDRAVVQGILAMTRHLELEVCAEGIETAAAHRWLCEAGCSRGQGYHFAHPMSVEALERYLEGEGN
jgi:EAL domain-containing protein (putative c-di-GMP-specific phosphodiesterase class I)